ncbi:MBL fold metallo-hydrolase [Nitrospinae bacterium AH_259_B05_G02_I21]|nr:MBL fold metallo-hydrolase [Nitrospinae bacterium AH_259_B05_G02_I21]
MILKAVEVGPELNFCYLLGCNKTGIGAIVDPSEEVPAILELAEREGISVQHILLTHAHGDHCSGVPEVVQATGAPIAVHAAEADNFQGHGDYNVVALQDGDTVALGEVHLEVIHTPGHSPGGVSFYHAPSKQVLTGDCLFVGYCGRADLVGSDPEALWRSLQRLADLPDETVTYPGHNYGVTPTSTIGEQKATNPYYLCASMEEFVELRLYGTVE